MAPEKSTLKPLMPLFLELNDLKRIRVADRDGSIASRLFRRAWAELVRGGDLKAIALRETAHAVAAARLAGIDALVMEQAGLPPEERQAIFEKGFDAVGGAIEPDHARQLRSALSPIVIDDPSYDEVPPFVELLLRQPRAGATRPGHQRVVLEPAENHAEHCAIVAVNAVVVAGVYGADPGMAFLSGLAHHLHNARLPDAGYAGDELLGEHLAPLMAAFRSQALAELPEALHGPIRDALGVVYTADTPEAKAFQAADVLDRVLEMRWHAQSAAFTLDVALHDMDIVHPGPVQLFQLDVMRDVELM